MAMCGKEMLSDNRILEGTSEIAKKLEMLDGDMEKLMREGKQLEVEMLFLITQNPSDWIKMPRTEEFVDIMCRFLNVLQESNALQFRWYEAFLNEIHLETEYSLRRIVTNDTQEGKSVEREKQLLNLLIYVIDEKARISEEIGDRTVDRSTVTKKELKRLKYKLQMALLSKKK
ncbi:hypothetical protein DICVIV_11473 [Dictyocaulus viviparus]|uniref:BMERB domain-containing protein n=1 Tax=Dictyocaulus viviparus TaxID=29172 RepID=A0A0D8XD41_DICVI|nr:hypothetical protein DICVIV_11473 [Dictyocaulus viviparus]